MDGAEAPVVPANVILRAVPAPPGRHVIDFVYRPRAVPPGLLTSCVFALGLVAAGLRLWPRATGPVG